MSKILGELDDDDEKTRNTTNRLYTFDYPGIAFLFSDFALLSVHIGSTSHGRL